MKKYRFNCGGLFIFYRGKTLGEALSSFIRDYPFRVGDLTAIIEEEVRENQEAWNAKQKKT